MKPRRALVRPPGDSFVHAISEHPHRDSIDPERARAQHARYREALSETGVSVTVLPPDEECPDSCFVQDLAVLAEDRALLCRPGAASRRPEVPKIEDAVRETVGSIESVNAPATVEGGDVLRVRGRFVVGLSQRTNEAGARAVERFARAKTLDTMVVPEPYLHLQTALGSPSDGVVVGPEPLLDHPVFADVVRVPAPEEEALGCNFIGVGRTVIMAAGFPATRSLIEELGVAVREVDLSEFLKADGGPTCLSLLV